MSKEHSYAYEAGYRDGSIHYELEHCPACKNVADLQEALDENAKLREERNHWKVEQIHAYSNWEDAHKRVIELEVENAKLRELVRAAWRCIHTGASCSDCRLIAGGCTLQTAMRELGVDE